MIWAHFDNASSLMQWTCTERVVPVILPKVLDSERVVLPGDEGYERADTDMRRADPKVFPATFERLWRAENP